MQIDSYSLPNPSRIEKSIAVLQTVNEALGGIVTNMPLGTENSYIYTVRITWSGITESELTDLRAAVEFLEKNYAYIKAPGLAGTIGSTSYPDAMVGTLSPGAPPKYQMEQGNVAGSSDMWFYSAEIEVVSEPGAFVIDENNFLVFPA